MAGHRGGRPDNPALAEAVRALRKQRKGPATPADIPPPSTFKGGRRVKLIPGQLDLDGREHLPDRVA